MRRVEGEEREGGEEGRRGEKRVKKLTLPNPYSLSLARRIASSSVSKGTMARTGPKASSFQIRQSRIEVVGLEVTRVGG